ncbi:hypothetical protein DERP_002742 [Dermatophagoides pteronyssinus]|uniref:Uncharacterized protein n=1 Tax=Dermatophagoides pteronyssinus TaxID=6956 RepID=A0ABQ8JVK0_DERPT|nr:hypothetical protein DERP_002742 [Dermatophagoides pteronyssinus]
MKKVSKMAPHPLKKDTDREGKKEIGTLKTIGPITTTNINNIAIALIIITVRSEFARVNISVGGSCDSINGGCMIGRCGPFTEYTGFVHDGAVVFGLWIG